MSELRSLLRAVPADLLLVGLAVPAGALVLVPGVDGSPLQFALMLPLVVFAPGYALVAAAFPAAEGDPGAIRNDADDAGARDGAGRSPGFLERLGLSVVATIVLVALAGIGLTAAGMEIGLEWLFGVLGGFTLVAAAVADQRRLALPPARRFSVDASRVTRAVGLSRPRSTGDVVVYAFVALCVVFALSSVTYAMTAADTGEPHTEFYLLAENESGTLVVGDYPTEFAVGEPRPLVVGIENNEREAMDYTVVVLAQRIETVDGTVEVVAERELHRFDPRVGRGEAWQQRHAVAPPFPGERVRLTYLLYEGGAPGDPSIESADRALELWVTVSDGNATASTR